MKLVDICTLKKFARWPESNEELLGYDKFLLWNVSGEIIYIFSPNGDVDYCTRAQWQAAVDALKAAENAAPEWNGEGLPPVGLCIELRHRYERPVGEFFRATIVAVGEKLFIANNESGETAAHIDSYEFRPIRTHEQIAADEREGVVEKMKKDIPGWVLRGGFGDIQTVCAMLYDAGYRKFEIVDN